MPVVLPEEIEEAPTVVFVENFEKLVDLTLEGVPVAVLVKLEETFADTFDLELKPVLSALEEIVTDAFVVVFNTIEEPLGLLVDEPKDKVEDV